MIWFIPWGLWKSDGGISEDNVQIIGLGDHKVERYWHHTQRLCRIGRKGVLFRRQRALLCLLPSGSKQCLSNWLQMLHMLESRGGEGRGTLISSWLFCTPVGRRSMAGIRGSGRKGCEAKIITVRVHIQPVTTGKTLLLHLGHRGQQGDRRTRGPHRELLCPQEPGRTGDCKGGPPDHKYNRE